MSQLFTSDNQNTGVSPLASVLPRSIQGSFPSRLTGLISLLSKGLSKFLQYHSLQASILQHSAFFMVQLSPQYVTTGKTTALTIWTFVNRVMSLLFNTLSRFVIAFLCLLLLTIEVPTGQDYCSLESHPFVQFSPLKLLWVNRKLRLMKIMQITRDHRSHC